MEMMEHEAPSRQPMKRGSDTTPPPVSEREPVELIQALRRSLAISLAVLHQPGGMTTKTSPADEVAYISTALSVLEQLSSGELLAATLQVVPVELADVLMQLLADWKTEAPRHSLELALPGDSPVVLADEPTVTHVTRLLLAGAIGLAPHGGSVRVSLRTHGEGALIGIRQHETLIADDRLPDIFEPFPLLPAMDTAQRAALLPLPVARTLVERHGGALWAEATPQATGMTFFAWWPHTPTLRPAHRTSGSEPSPSPTRLPLDRREPVLLILEGDARMARYLRANLEARGFQAHTCESEDDTLKCIDREEPDLLLVDGGLPSMEDAHLLARLREYASAPVIVLGQSPDPRLCARLLDAGATDYVPRPFNIEELMARIRAALRVSQASAGAAAHAEVVTVGSLDIDLAHQQVRESGRPIALSRTEYRLLRALAQHPGMVVSHTQLLERVWGVGYEHETEFLWVYIRRLRRKLEPDPAHPRYILTAPGIGYQLAEAASSVVESARL